MKISKLQLLLEDIMQWIEIIDGIELKRTYDAIAFGQPSTFADVFNYLKNHMIQENI